MECARLQLAEMENADNSEDDKKTATAMSALRQERSEDATTKDVFVGNLSYYSTAEKIKTHFGTFGNVRDVRLLQRPGSRQGRRYCFVTFSNEASARSAIAAPSHLLDGKVLVVRPASGRHDSAAAAETTTGKDKGGGARIFVGGIGQEIGGEALAGHFSSFGTVLSTEVLRDRETKRSRGFAFVDFASKSSAEQACAQHYHVLGKRRVEVKLAQPKAGKTSAEVKPTTEFAAPLLDNQALQKVILDQWVSSIKTLQYYSTMLSQQYGQQQQQYIWPVSSSASHRYSPYLVPAQQESLGFVPSPPVNALEGAGVVASQPHLFHPHLTPSATANPLLFPGPPAPRELVDQMPFVQYSGGEQQSYLPSR